jgi:hypothetical protein
MTTLFLIWIIFITTQLNLKAKNRFKSLHSLFSPLVLHFFERIRSFQASISLSFFKGTLNHAILYVVYSIIIKYTKLSQFNYLR